MTTRNYAQSIGAGGTITLPAGIFFYIRTANSALDIQTQGNPGSPMDFIGIGAGSKWGPVSPDKAWKTLRVTSAAAQNVEIIVSDDSEFDVANAVSILGAATTIEAPATTFTNRAFVTVGVAQAALFAANLSRRRITVFAHPNNADNIEVRAAGGGNTIGIIQAGTSFTFVNTGALDAISGTAGQIAFLCEES